jgi:tetratricopeptide (TPR) repeat protein
MKKEKRNIILTVVGNILLPLYLFTQAEVELDKLILTDDTQLFGTIIKKNIQGIEFKAQNEKSSRKVEFEKIHTFLYAEAKNQWELIYDAILTNNFSKAIEFLTSLESATKKQTMKEDIKFFLAICYFNQKNYDKFFSTLESLISEFSESFYLYHILAFIVEVLDLLEAKDISINLNTFVRQAISHLSKQKQEAISTISKLLEGYLKEASGSIDEGVSIYKEIRSQESAGYVVSTTATILLARHLIKKGKYEEAIKELNSKKVKLTT